MSRMLSCAGVSFVQPTGSAGRADVGAFVHRGHSCGRSSPAAPLRTGEDRPERTLLHVGPRPEPWRRGPTREDTAQVGPRLPRLSSPGGDRPASAALRARGRCRQGGRSLRHRLPESDLRLDKSVFPPRPVGAGDVERAPRVRPRCCQRRGGHPCRSRPRGTVADQATRCREARTSLAAAMSAADQPPRAVLSPRQRVLAADATRRGDLAIERVMTGFIRSVRTTTRPDAARSESAHPYDRRRATSHPDYMRQARIRTQRSSRRW